MRFSSSLKFNTVADWWDDYIAYDTLKRCLYQLEKQLYASRYRDDTEASEHAALLSAVPSTSADADAAFVPLSDRELAKICNFYKAQEKEMFQEYEDIEKTVRRLEERGVRRDYRDYYEDDDEDDDDDDDESVSQSPVGRRRRPSRSQTGVNEEDLSPRPPTQPASPVVEDSPRPTTSAHPHFQIPDSPRQHTGQHTGQGRQRSQSYSASYGNTFPRAKSRSTSVGGAFASTLQSLKDSFTSGGPPIDDDDHHRGRGSYREESIWTSQSNYAYDTRLLLKRRMTKLYIDLTNLRSYVELNYTGFRKIIKKYNKVIGSNLEQTYLPTIQSSYPFSQPTRDRLNNTITSLTTIFAKCITNNDHSLAQSQLRSHQREQIAWERDTVWRLMIGRERRGELVDIGSRTVRGGSVFTSRARTRGFDGNAGEVVDVEEATGGGATLIRVRDPSLGLFRIPLILPNPLFFRGKPVNVVKMKVTKRRLWFLISVATFWAVLHFGVIKDGNGWDNPANACFAVLLFCTILWASEAIPLFVTSLFVPLLLVVLRVIKDINGERLSTPEATKFVFSIIFSPTIMLLIGGFTISSALSKTNIDKLIITRVLSMAGTRPSTVLLSFMAVSCFASMWISNVAAPTLCFTLIRPILRTLPPKSAFAPCLILGIALAANVGGQSSPISSPQNLIALQAMDPPLDWARWFAVALPVSAISILLIWLLLLVSYHPSRLPPPIDMIDDDWNSLSYRELEIKPIRPTKESFTAKQYWVTCVCLVTISLWCVAHEIEDYVGDMGIVAILPIVAFFGTGVLKKDDFEHFAWSIVFLAMGGIALGKGVVESGLLIVMDDTIRKMLDGFSLYTVVLILSPVVLIISTFISHTIASVLLVPIAKEVGSKLSGGHSNLLIFITGLICSTGMGMPVSGFPNQTAAAQEDELGETYLTNIDFLKNGVPASIIATLVVVTIGFVLMKLIGL